MCDDLRRAIKALIIKINHKTCEEIERLGANMINMGLAVWFKFCPIVLAKREEDTGQGFQLRAYTGCFTEDGLKMIVDDHVCKPFTEKYARIYPCKQVANI